MYPVLFSIGGIPVYGFGVMMALAFLLGTLWAARRAEVFGLDADRLVWLMAWVIVLALVGARLLYVFYFPNLFWMDPLGVLIASGGLVWYGGMAGAVAALALFARRHGFTFWQLGDILAAPTALGMAIGRVGCLLAGCCYGGPCELPWAIRYPHTHETHGMPVHPAPIYESLNMLLAAWLISRLPLDKAHPGRPSALFLMLYAVNRFIIESVRGDRLVWFEPLNLSASQVISLAVFAVGLALWVRFKRPVQLA
jgi:phosphatidylglycerol:prolipoprotein diacylglycerol transferase